MFIGHYALGLASRRNNTLPSLAMMFIAVQMLDLLWPIFTLIGWESFQIEPGITKLTPLNFVSYPYSHSLLMSVVWGALLGVVYFLITKNKQGSVLLGVLVVSHWILDLLTHRPDLQLTPFSDMRVGLGLWNEPALEITIEFTMFFAGAFLYYKSGCVERKISYWLLIAFFTLMHLGNLFGPPPSSTIAISWSANLLWIFVLWAWWVEKKKQK